ncbi:MAG: hypothetical protein IPP14_15800 [Planctomycetes bacterium]|nr:hypothetical protein [Planctomycetota bacterium]
MAGGDPMDPITEPLDGMYEPEMQQLRQRPSGAQRAMARYKKYKQWKETQDKALAGAATLEATELPAPTAPVVDDPEDTFERLTTRNGDKGAPNLATSEGRIAERLVMMEDALRDRQNTIETFDDLDEFYISADRVADYKTELFNRVRKQALDDYKAKRIDAATFRQRQVMLVGEDGKSGMKAQIDMLRKSVNEGLAKAMEDRKAAELVAQTQADDDLGVWKYVGGKMLRDAVRSTLQSAPVQWIGSALSAPLETAGGVVSPLASALGGNFNTKLEASDYNPLSTPMLEEASGLRTRGREFWKLTGQNLAAYHEAYPTLSMLSNPAAEPMMVIDLLEKSGRVDAKDAHEYRAMAGELVVSTAADPLNLLPGGALKNLAKLEKAAYANRAFLAFAKKFPKLAYAPGKFVRYAAGYARAAQALGDPQLTKVMIAETALNEAAGYEMLRLRHNFLESEAALVKPLNDVQREALYARLPSLVEGGKEARASLAASTDPYEKALSAAADLYDDAAAKLWMVENKYGMKVAKLDGQFSYFQRQFGDELTDWIAKRPNAQQAMFGAKQRRSGMAEALEAWEKGRTLKDMSFAEAEEAVRSQLRPLGLKDDVPIFSRDAFGDLAKRTNKSLEAIKMRNFGLNFVQEFGVPTGPQAVDDLMAQWAKIEVPAPKVSQVDVAGFDASATAARQDQAAARATAQQAEAAERAQLGDALRAEGEARNARAQYQQATQSATDANAAKQAAQDDYFKAQEAYNATGAQSANDAMKDATRRLQEALADLRNAKNANPAQVAELKARVAAAEKAAADAADTLKGAGDRVARAREAASKADAAAADWAQKAQAAKDEWAKYAEAAQHNNPANWSVDAKAQWVKARAPSAPPAPGVPMNALDALMRLKTPLPDDIGELARLATTWISPEDGAKFGKYVENFHWKHVPQDTTAVGRWWDDWKRIMQKAGLARVGSVTKDNIGAFGQNVLAGNLPHLAGAVKDLGGTPWNWAKGAYKIPDDAVWLEAKGALATTVDEVNQAGGRGLLRSPIQKYGVLGTLARPFGKDVAEKVAGFTDTLLHQRQFGEAASRLATFRKGIADGLSKEDALEMVYAHFGKFDELTKLERTVFNRIFFFWSWKARSVPVTIANVLDHPVKMRLMLMAAAGDARGENGNRMPEWMKRMGGWILGTDPNGNMEVMSTGGSLYSSPTIGFLQGDMMKAMQSGDWEKVPGQLGREYLTSAPPMAQSAVELATSKDYFTNQDWWKDGDPSKGSQMKAPSFMYWLTNKGRGEETAIQKLLDLKPEYDDKQNLRRVTMNPTWAWLLDALPGVSPLMADASAFVDPRREKPGAAVPTGASLVPGISRQLGLPIYHVAPPDNVQASITSLRKALRSDVARMSGDALQVDDYGQIRPNKKSIRGQQLATDRERWQDEARQQSLGPAQARAYVGERMRRFYLDEWRLYELSERIDVLKELANNEYSEAKDLKPKVKMGLAPESKYAKQAENERKRLLAKLGTR